MVHCITCGASASDAANSCPSCGAQLHTIPETVAVGETVAISAGAPASSPSRPRTSTSSARLSITSIPDEGRFLPGTLLAGRYRIIGLLGRGGMGEVYRATDLTLAQSVALKFLPEEATSNQPLLERFHSEVRIARQVSHPNVCRVYDIGEADGLPFISMEYIDGEDLGALLQRIGRLPSDKALEIARKLCAGLSAAHERGVIHRDLKPQNVMLNKRGEVVIMDFGLAAVADQLQGAEARQGTPAYMSPEQLRGDSVSPRSDIYALGLIIYELFTGKRAYDAATVDDLMRMQETSHPASITSIAQDVDPAVERVIWRCLSADPAQRPASALQVAAALPGGDPLAAALAAGETPSPELVAAAGKAEGFPLRYALTCLVFSLAVLIAGPLLLQNTDLLNVTPSPYPPAVLSEKAKDVAAQLGYPNRPADDKNWLGGDSEEIKYFQARGGKPDWNRIFTAESPLTYSYRQSPVYLSGRPDGIVRWMNPPRETPGMIHARLDLRGRLRYFLAVSPNEGDGPALSFDPGVLFRIAGLDPSQFHEVAPNYVPNTAFDERRAWTGTFPGLDNVQITLEAALWKGRPVSFYMRWPWTKPEQSAPTRSSARELAFELIPVVTLTCGLFFAVIMARRNVVAGRGDRSGAFRTATVAFLLLTAAELVDMHLIPSFDMVGFIFADVSVVLAISGLLWLAYMALEPAVRSRWPHSLITWTRLMNGEFGDPRVGSHILAGVTIAEALIGFFAWRSWALANQGAAPSSGNLGCLLGARAFVSVQFQTVAQAMLAGTTLFFVVSGIRFVARRDWAAAGVASLFLVFAESGLRESTHLAIDLALYILVYFALMFVLVRMGLLPAVIALFALNSTGRITFGPEFSSWQNSYAVMHVLIVASLAIFAFWRSQSKPRERLASARF